MLKNYIIVAFTDQSSMHLKPSENILNFTPILDKYCVWGKSPTLSHKSNK